MPFFLFFSAGNDFPLFVAHSSLQQKLESKLEDSLDRCHLRIAAAVETALSEPLELLSERAREATDSPGFLEDRRRAMAVLRNAAARVKVAREDLKSSEAEAAEVKKRMAFQNQEAKILDDIRAIMAL